jgi:hypothetical protein
MAMQKVLGSPVSQREQGVVTLCGDRGCCPTVDFSREQVIIRDDFGGSVQLSQKEWAELKRLFAD